MLTVSQRETWPLILVFKCGVPSIAIIQIWDSNTYQNTNHPPKFINLEKKTLKGNLISLTKCKRFNQSHALRIYKGTLCSILLETKLSEVINQLDRFGIGFLKIQSFLNLGT